MRHSIVHIACLALALGGFSCGDSAATQNEEPNAFLQDWSNPGKQDSAYLNPDGIEVEVDLEGEVEGPSYRLLDAPAELGQFALTYLRKRGQIYLESLAEDASATGKAEWLIGDTWMSADQVSLPNDALHRFRLRGVNAVLLFDASQGVEVGTTLPVKVPLNPFTLMQEVGSACADESDHMELSGSIYWYLWNPDLPDCTAATQDLKVTVSKMMPKHRPMYPEYDRLVQDGKLTAVVVFGQVGEGDLSPLDQGLLSHSLLSNRLKRAGYTEVVPAPIGRRFTKKAGELDVIFDLYSPRDFAGLNDFAHYQNFETALNEHEIVIYYGHSLLGASDFWSRPSYPDFYQIFLYGGCLGYEYYVRPILKAKGGWDNVDIVSSVVEVPASASKFIDPFLAKIVWATEHGYRASWRDLLLVIREQMGNSNFGVSGVRENKFCPPGVDCGSE